MVSGAFERGNSERSSEDEIYEAQKLTKDNERIYNMRRKNKFDQERIRKLKEKVTNIDQEVEEKQQSSIME